MNKGFVVSAILYPLLVLTLALILGIISMSDNRRKILDNMKLEISEESETDPEMSNSALYYKMKALEEAYAELSMNVSEERFEELKADYENKITLAKNQAKLESVPVGSIFISTTSTNPSSYIGGTWEAYGQGRTLIGVGSNETSSYSAGAIGGSEVHDHTGIVGGTTLTTAQIPGHTHTIPALKGTAASAGSHNHAIGGTVANSSSHIHTKAGSFAYGMSDTPYSYASGLVKASGAHTHSVTTVATTSGATGGATAHTHTLTVNSASSQSPYVVVYFWKRTS